MSLFDNILGNNTVENKLTAMEAFAAITLVAVACDGYLSDKEAESVCLALSKIHLFQGYSRERINALLEKLLEVLRNNGLNALFNAAKASLSEEMRESAFAIAVDLVLMDGKVTSEEHEFLNDLCQALGIKREMAMQIVQVMMIKHRS